MSRQAIELLKRLYKRSESSGSRKRDVTEPASRIKGYPFINAALLTEFHEYLNQVESEGLIHIDWRAGFEDYELIRVRLVNSRKLAGHLGITPLVERIKTAREQIDSIDKPDWLTPYIRKIFDCWDSSKSAYGLKPAAHETLSSVIQAINGIASMDEGQTMDYRQFGARYLGGSKKLKEIESPLCAIYREKLELQNLDKKDLLASLNLTKLAHPLFITGPLVIEHASKEISLDVEPYIGIPYSMLKKFTFKRVPEYILTIENLSSFNEHTENIPDNAVILYTAGYPTSNFQRFYAHLVSKLKTSEVLHWGDTDPHGFQILKTLQRCVPNRIIKPHLMNEPIGLPFSASNISHLKELLPINPQADELIESIIKSDSGKYEQELILAKSPNAF